MSYFYKKIRIFLRTKYQFFGFQKLYIYIYIYFFLRPFLQENKDIYIEINGYFYKTFFFFIKIMPKRNKYQFFGFQKFI